VFRVYGLGFRVKGFGCRVYHVLQRAAHLHPRYVLHEGLQIRVGGLRGYDLGFGEKVLG